MPQRELSPAPAPDAKEVAGRFFHYFYPGVAPSVDRLLPVADEKEARLLDAPFARAFRLLGQDDLLDQTRSFPPGVDQCPDEPPLIFVRVLELVDEKMMVAGLEAKAALRELSSPLLSRRFTASSSTSVKSNPARALLSSANRAAA